MIYKDYKGLKISELGFGCMRFKAGEDGEIDQAKVNAMFDLAISNGVNYFDTAYPYLNGKSETAMAKGLEKYPRSSYFLADKFPGHSLPGPIDNIALFNVSLKKCNTDYFDFYLLHNITEWSVKIYEDENYHIIPDMIRMREEGKIRHLGFSFHGGPDLLEEFLTRHEGMFEFVQIQFNYLDWTLQNAKRKYEIITSHGLDVWVMEPLRGGKLAILPEDCSARMKQFDPQASDASWAFRYLQQFPAVKVILSGMTEVSDVEDNLKSFVCENPATEEETAALYEIAETMKSGVPCTSCRYCCDGCPVGLNIPFLLDCYNSYKTAPNNMPTTMRLNGVPEDKLADACIACGHCMQVCPQGIDVPAAMQDLDKLYKAAPAWSTIAKKRSESIRKDLGM